MTKKLNELRKNIDNYYRKDEAECIEALIEIAQLPPDILQKVQSRATSLVESIRAKRLGQGGIDAFLKEYNLSDEEGIALMCLAEAMLRIPDKATQNKLIADKIAMADWSEHAGRSDSFFVNTATWGLILTGKILSDRPQSVMLDAFKSMMRKVSVPMIRTAMLQAMKRLGDQFVMGENIAEAQNRAVKLEAKGYLFSYDMLGEAARTAVDAERYMQSYLNAIEAIGQKAKDDPIRSSGISIKLSALFPRYEFTHHEAAVEALVPKLKILTQKAKQHNISLTVDAEEADRLNLSLDIIEKVFCDPEFADWEGFGLAVQSYQKRAYYVLDWLIALSQQQKKRIFVRLIKGAYWDGEIKISQVGGFVDYPVFTRKVSTDVSFLACARKILAHPETFYAQFATHNAFSVAAILELAEGRKDFEFQCLHGMGYTLYDEVINQTGLPCRVYAPVGGHEDLLAYLVRRLLENGANSSFVNRILDEKISVYQIVQDPVEQLSAVKPKANPYIPLPRNIYLNQHSARINSLGLDFSHPEEFAALQNAYAKALTQTWEAKPTLAKGDQLETSKAVKNPATGESVGEVCEAKSNYFEDALTRATSAFEAWTTKTVDERAAILNKAADLLEMHHFELMCIATYEGGKTLLDANAEVREAVDFCRYYAEMAIKTLKPEPMPGPTGEMNILGMYGRGVIACISPWNFPLAIFLGQVAAALVAGNTVLAKPAGQTPLIAARAVALLHEAGVPPEALQLVIASGRLVGEKIIADERIKGVIFTGSTDTAQHIHQTLAARKGPIVPLIAETGGQNAMIVDSSSLPEQVVQDVIISAFGSAGQRCSALRVLFLQEDIADKTITMLKGAMQALVVGNPAFLSSDIGPVIDEHAKKGLLDHKQYLSTLPEVKLIAEVAFAHEQGRGSFFSPCAYEIPNIHVLKHEVFGPVLHVIRYRAEELDDVIAQINSTGYGLTMGIQSRIDHVVRYIAARMKVGNIYVNRNMIGAVVGVQPFGGEGLSGTGPKAGGPHYLLRLCTERTLTINTTAAGGNATLMAAAETGGI
jgi:RHH-type proline utilization regulon transcriptional repressor/proline dehydrogenase/delta 1-pyrroline-5-carboxylate dehydrogenase